MDGIYGKDLSIGKENKQKHDQNQVRMWIHMEVQRSCKPENRHYLVP